MEDRFEKIIQKESKQEKGMYEGSLRDLNNKVRMSNIF